MSETLTKEVLIFCESYPQIKNTLYVATHSGDNHPITIVITGNSDLLRFFKVINEKVFHDTINIVYFDTYLGRMAKAGNRISKAFFLLPDIVRERQYLKAIFNKCFAELRGAEIFFFSRCYNPSTFYLLKRLSKTNRLVYMPEPSYDVLSIDKAAPANITEALYLLRCKMVYGWDILLGKHPLGQKITRMPDKFFSGRVARVINREERDSMLQNFDESKFKVFDSGNYSVMYFHDDLEGFIKYNYIADAAAYERRLTEIFNIIGKYFPTNEVAVKYHPGSGESKMTMPLGTVLPDFIPAEFLYNEKIKMYLGISSMALSNIGKGLAVSLIDLLSFKNDTIRERLKEYLIEWSRSEVLFPKSLDEFEEILVSINQEHRGDS